MAKKHHSKKPKSTPPRATATTAAPADVPKQPTAQAPVPQPSRPASHTRVPNATMTGTTPPPPTATSASTSAREIILGCPAVLQEFFRMSDAELTGSGPAPSASRRDFTLANEYPLAPQELRMHRRYTRIPVTDGVTADDYIAWFTFEGYRMLDEYAAKYPHNKKLRKLAKEPRDTAHLFETALRFGRSRGLESQIPSGLTKAALEETSTAVMEYAFGRIGHQMGGTGNASIPVGSQLDAETLVSTMTKSIGDMWDVKAVKYNAPGGKMPTLPDGTLLGSDDAYDGGYSITFERRAPPAGAVKAPIPGSARTGRWPPGVPADAVSGSTRQVKVPVTGPAPPSGSKTSSQPTGKPAVGSGVALASTVPTTKTKLPAPTPAKRKDKGTGKSTQPAPVYDIEIFKKGSVPSDGDDDLGITAGLAATHRQFMADITSGFASTPRELCRVLSGTQIAMRALAIAANDGYQVYTHYAMEIGFLPDECLPFWEFMVKYERAILFGALRFDDWRS
ncbi:uncharacterized protein LOC62_02G003390 [Vanrija pseudolonga]|uniref:Uncharacterized protein n=1 Tax=Vanrija pseudolonga TaxID=143232 RepID=A0AAF0Y5T1_9TREE|nr:hypothetical protein LOC62_02G003390 [Vanrija pseudolonga]